MTLRHSRVWNFERVSPLERHSLIHSDFVRVADGRTETGKTE